MQEEIEMNREKDGKTFWEKLATFIVDKRNLFFFLYMFYELSADTVMLCKKHRTSAVRD